MILNLTESYIKGNGIVNHNSIIVNNIFDCLTHHKKRARKLGEIARDWGYDKYSSEVLIGIIPEPEKSGISLFLYGTTYKLERELYIECDRHRMICLLALHLPGGRFRVIPAPDPRNNND